MEAASKLGLQQMWASKKSVSSNLHWKEKVLKRSLLPTTDLHFWPCLPLHRPPNWPCPPDNSLSEFQSKTSYLRKEIYLDIFPNLKDLKHFERDDEKSQKASLFTCAALWISSGSWQNQISFSCYLFLAQSISVPISEISRFFISSNVFDSHFWVHSNF